MGTAIARKNPSLPATRLLQVHPAIAPEFRTLKSKFKSGVFNTLYSCVPGTFGKSKTALPLVTVSETPLSWAITEPQIAADKANARPKCRANCIMISVYKTTLTERQKVADLMPPRHPNLVFSGLRGQPDWISEIKTEQCYDPIANQYPCSSSAKHDSATYCRQPLCVDQSNDEFPSAHPQKKIRTLHYDNSPGH